MVLSNLVAVAGIWELGWNTPIKEADEWVFLRDFGVDRFYMVPVSGIATNALPIIERPSLEAVLDENPELPIVIVDEKGQETLRDFEHPASCLYMFGKTACSSLYLKKPEHRSLRIETVANSALLWAHQACAIVLYDRMVKSWR